MFGLKKEFLDGLFMGSVKESFENCGDFSRVVMLYHRFYPEGGCNRFLRNVNECLRNCTVAYKPIAKQLFSKQWSLPGNAGIMQATIEQPFSKQLFDTFRRQRTPKQQ
jgi:hypothetical protein